MNKLLIGIPSLEYVNIDFVKCLVALIIKLKAENIDFDVHIESGTLVYMARDKIASKAVNEGYNEVLWLDADMIFTPDVLEDLRFSGKQFVTGIAHSRRKGYGSCVFKNIELQHLSRYSWDEYPNNTFQIAGCGLACVLMKTEVLKQVFTAYNTCFTPIPNYGEDLAFCKRCGELGIAIFAEPAVRLGHIGHTVIYPEAEGEWLKQMQTCLMI